MILSVCDTTLHRIIIVEVRPTVVIRSLSASLHHLPTPVMLDAELGYCDAWPYTGQLAYSFVLLD